MAKQQEELTSLVNASGFAFQLGVEQVIRQTERSHGWRVISREHPWSLNDQQGFIDLTISKGIVNGVIECKRVRDGSWVFLVPNGEEARNTHSRVLWVAGKERKSLSGWDWVEHLPDSYVSSFCVVRGGGEGDRPLLERLCSTLLASVDALAQEEVSILQRRYDGWHGFYLPMIVTTARLHLCRFKPNEVDLVTGTLSAATFEEVPFIRFNKGFSTSRPPGAEPGNLADAANAHERTVLVVRADHLTKFLAGVQQPAFSDPYPWAAPLATLDKRTK